MTPLLAATLFAFGCKEKQVAAPLEQSTTVGPHSFSTSPDFDGQNAYLHCHNICALGPRLSGSPAYAAQLDYLEKHLTAAGWKVERDSFPVRGINMINLRAVKGESTAARPLLLSCHIDTKTIYTFLAPILHDVQHLVPSIRNGIEMFCMLILIINAVVKLHCIIPVVD